MALFTRGTMNLFLNYSPFFNGNEYMLLTLDIELNNLTIIAPLNLV